MALPFVGRAAALLAALSCALFLNPARAEDIPYVLKTPSPASAGERSRFAVVDKTGKLLFRGDPTHELVDDEYKLGYLKIRKGKKVGLLDPGGKITLQPRYERVFRFNEKIWDTDAFAYVTLDDSTSTCVDRAGKELIPTRDKHRIYCPVGGYALVEGPRDPVSKKIPIGIIDRKGDFVIALGRFEDFNAVAHGRVRAMQGGKWGVIDMTGAFVIAPEFDQMYGLNGSVSILRVVRAGKWGVIDDAGKVLLPLEFERLGDEWSEDRLAARRDGKWGYLDRSGNFAIPPSYHTAKPFRNGLAEVTIDKKHGFIDLAGKTVIPLQYDDVQQEAGLIRARTSGPGADRIFDMAGREIKAPGLERYPFQEIDPAGVLVVRAWGSAPFGLADAKGNVLAEPVFFGTREVKNSNRRELLPFRDGLTPARRYERIGPYAWRMDYGLLSSAGQLTPVPELGGAFGPFYEGLVGNDKREVVMIGANPGLAGLWGWLGGNFSAPPSVYEFALNVIVFPLLFCVWWASAWRIALVHTAGTPVTYGRAWRSMILWILLAAAWGVGCVTALGLIPQDTRAKFELVENGLIVLPLFFGMVIAGTQLWKKEKPLKSSMTVLLAFLAFTLLSAALFAPALEWETWFDSYWALVVFAALFGLSLVLRKRAPLAGRSLKELALAGCAAWVVVLLWLQVVGLFGTYI